MSHVTYLTLLFSALLISLVLTPLAKLVGPRLSAMDTPNALSIHSSPTPRTGGLAVLAHQVYGLTDAITLGAKPGFLLWMLLGLMAALYRLESPGETRAGAQARPGA